MFSITQNGKITITKGDSASLTVNLENADGTEYEMQSGDKLTMTVRRAPGSAVLMQVVSANNVIYLPAVATKNLIVGTLVYDVELKTASGEVHTVLGPKSPQSIGNMVVLPEITE